MGKGEKEVPKTSFILIPTSFGKKLNTMKTKTKRKFNFDTRFVVISNICLVLVIFLSLFINLISSTQAATEGFVLRSLSSKLTDLKNDNKELNIISAQLQSIQRIQKISAEELGMISDKDINYFVTKKEEAVAIR